MSSSNKELEVKFYLADLGRLRETLDGLDAGLVQPRTHERNLRFDTPEMSLTRSAQVLRLRRDTVNRLTYKGPPNLQTGVSERIEIEFTVGDFENTQALLEALGYQISMIYEKYRTIYEIEETLVTLDETPLGNFAEIEGLNAASIETICIKVGLLWKLRTLQSYSMLFQIAKQALGLSCRDLTFENFAELQVGPSHLKLVPADLLNTS